MDEEKKTNLRLAGYKKLTLVQEVLQNILCVSVTLPGQGQTSFHRLHSSSMHISHWEMNTQRHS